MKSLKAVIFDMDGVIVDTKGMHLKAMQNVFKDEYGINIPKSDYDSLFGKLDVEGLRFLLKKYRLKGDMEYLRKRKKEELEKAQKGNLRLFPGAKELIRNLSKKYRLALTSSEWKDIIYNVLDHFGIRKYFSVIVGKEDIRKHKPDPYPYLYTARKLGVKASECVVIEDSVAGVESGKRAGMNVIAVTTSYSREKLKKADIIVRDVAEIKV